MVPYHIFMRDPCKVAKEFKFFNTCFEKLLDAFKSITGKEFRPGEIPQVTMKMDEGESEIDNFLQKIGLFGLSDIFEKEELDIDDLFDMNNIDLKDIGIHQLKHRKAILKEIEKLKGRKKKKDTKFNRKPGNQGKLITEVYNSLFNICRRNHRIKL